MNKKVGDLIAFLFVAAIVVYLVFFTDQFTQLTSKSPYLMGFIKFMLLAPFGRLLAGRLFLSRTWQLTPKIIPIAFLWGLVGIWITSAFPQISAGTEGLITVGMWPDVSGWSLALSKSLWINFLSGYAFFMMTMHELAERWLLGRLEGKKRLLKDIFLVMAAENWFVPILISIFLFWIIAHTLTFMLPPDLRIIFAASLSMVLGLIKARISMYKVSASK